MGMFKRRQSKTDASDSGSSAPSPNRSTASYSAYSNYEEQQSSSPARSTASAPAINGTTTSNSKKKKGIGSKLKGLVRVSSKKSAGDSKSVGSTSSQEQNLFFNDEPAKMNKRVVPRQQQLQDLYESSSSSEEDEDHFHQELGTVAEVNEDDYNSDGELRPKSKKRLGQIGNAAASGGASTINSQKKKKKNDFPIAATVGGEDADENIISLVILLVDPTTNRFEFLHLEQRRKKNLKVKNILNQFKTGLTESSLKKLQFEGLLDRLGQVHKPNSLLSNAMGFHPNKDILVGLIQGVSVDQLLLTVRPILGDRKMGQLLVTNGFDTKGWVKKKKTKDSILDKKPPPIKVEQQGGALSIIAFTICIIGILAGVDTCLIYLNQKGSFVQPLIYWPNVMESAGDLALQGAQAAKEAILQGNSTAALAMVNSTIAAVEETALEAVSDVKEFVPSMMIGSSTKSMSKSSSPKAVLDTAKTISKMAGVSSSSSSSPTAMLDTAKNVAKMAAASYSSSSSMMSSPSQKVMFNTAKNMMGVPAKVAANEVVSETTVPPASSSSSSSSSSTIMANVSNAIANVTNSLANATKTATGNTTTSTPNAVWEDYVLIGLLVCWFLYWMAI